MKLFKAVTSTIGKMVDFAGAIIAVGLLLLALSGMITVGCSQSFWSWTNQYTCTLTTVFNLPK